MPEPKSKARSFRMPIPLLTELDAIAANDGVNLNALVIQQMAKYARERGAKLPDKLGPKHNGRKDAPPSSSEKARAAAREVTRETLQLGPSQVPAGALLNKKNARWRST